MISFEPSQRAMRRDKKNQWHPRGVRFPTPTKNASQPPLGVLSQFTIGVVSGRNVSTLDLRDLLLVLYSPY